MEAWVPQEDGLITMETLLPLFPEVTVVVWKADDHIVLLHNALQVKQEDNIYLR